MKTFEERKDRFRVHQIGNEYYLQEKDLFGWSYDTGAYDKSYNNTFTFTFSFLTVALLISILLVISGVIILIFMKSPLLLLISIISFLLFSFLTILYTHTSLNLAKKCFSLKDAEESIDVIVSQEMYNEKIKEDKKLAKKQQKYHYFYSERKMRSEKLKKINKN